MQKITEPDIIIRNQATQNETENNYHKYLSYLPLTHTFRMKQQIIVQQKENTQLYRNKFQQILRKIN